LPLYDHERRLVKAVAALDKFAYDVIGRRKQLLQSGGGGGVAGREDLLSMFLSNNLGGGGAVTFTDKNLRDMILNFVIAGRDTTATTLSFLFHNFAQNPAAMKLAIEEVDRVFAGRTPDYESVKNLPYMKACIDETLRIFPPVPMDIKSPLKDDVLPNGATVKAGENVYWCAWDLGRNPKYWKDPDSFVPDRWFHPETSNGGLALPNGVTPPFIPFQYGPRLCLGVQMAYLEVKLMAVLILQNFELRPDPARPTQVGKAITLNARSGVWLSPVARTGK
jgi:cytochrome P450